METIYDLELAELILEKLKKIYSIKDKQNVYRYFLSRFVCSEILTFNIVKKELSNILYNYDYRKKIIDFTLNEIGILTYSDYFIYNDVKIDKYNIVPNSMTNILIELEHLCIDIFNRSMFFEDTLLILKKIYSSGKRKSNTKRFSIL